MAGSAKERPKFLERSVIVGAHPDDELLWFNSIVRDVEEIIIVYCDFWAQPDIGAARRKALADYPRGNVSCLDIPESGACGCADWSDPSLSPHGVALGLEASRRELTRLARRSLATMAIPSIAAPTSVSRLYEKNFHTLHDALKERLAPDMNVFTHNPWGEYGHEEHVQVFRALQRLREEIGFTLWMSNYCTERALPLAMHYFETRPGAYVRLPTDKVFADEVAAVYRKHDCWTWSDEWTWFDEECFREAPRLGGQPEPHRHLFPLNFFTIDTARSRRWLPIALTASASAALAVTLSETI